MRIDDEDINRLLRALSAYDVRYLSEVKRTLEEYFMHFYENRPIADWDD